QVVKRPAFPVEEYQALPKEGTGKVKGELFGMTRGGDVKIGAGSKITLRPYTTYIKNTPQINYNTQILETIDGRAVEYDKTVLTDAQGKFEFENVPPGQYEVFGSFSWYAGNYPQVIILDEIITVKNGDVIQVQP
ncbi:carboxypeptidase regulatory-like domain-containing protein, partial [Escherichia coli]|nr:carboxypeptidase regulatory-like domain-containing protein [Escherichia coli]